MSTNVLLVKLKYEHLLWNTCILVRFMERFFVMTTDMQMGFKVAISCHQANNKATVANNSFWGQGPNKIRHKCGLVGHIVYGSLPLSKCIGSCFLMLIRKDYCGKGLWAPKVVSPWQELNNFLSIIYQWSISLVLKCNSTKVIFKWLNLFHFNTKLICVRCVDYPFPVYSLCLSIKPNGPPEKPSLTIRNGKHLLCRKYYQSSSFALSKSCVTMEIGKVRDKQNEDQSTNMGRAEWDPNPGSTDQRNETL